MVFFRRRTFLRAGAALVAATAREVAARSADPAAKRLALALGSGSLHGHAFLGVMRVFEQRGLRPDLIVGSSVGAIVGALWAAGLTSAEIQRAAARFDLWRNLRLSWSRRGLFKNKALQQTIRSLTGGRHIETWPMRFAAVASDLATGERVIIDRGDPAIAVAASSSLPVLCTPVRWGERWLVDGGLTEPVPVKAARELGAERVVAIDIAYRPHDAPVDSLSDAAFQALHILVNALIAEQIRHADVAIRLDLHPLMEKRKEYASVLMAAAEKAVEEQWPRIAGR